jgi:hypothetical protein
VKIAAVVIALFVAGLAYLSYRGWIDVKWVAMEGVSRSTLTNTSEQVVHVLDNTVLLRIYECYGFTVVFSTLFIPLDTISEILGVFSHLPFLVHQFRMTKIVTNTPYNTTAAIFSAFFYHNHQIDKMSRQFQEKFLNFMET